MYRIPDFLAWLLSPFITFRLRNGDISNVFLTFDDGPDPGSTPEIVAALDKCGVKASFFITGSQAESFPDLVDIIRNKGHAIHMHGYQHKKIRNFSKAEFFNDLKTCHNLLKSKYLRPPYGKIPLRFIMSLKRKGFRIILWNVDPQDYKPDEINTEKLSSLLRKIRKGDIILLHDKPRTNEKTILLIYHITNFLKSKGVTFSTII